MRVDADGRALPGEPLPLGWCSGCRCPERFCACDFDAYGCRACGHWLSGCACREPAEPPVSEHAGVEQHDQWHERFGNKTPAEVCEDLRRQIGGGRR